MHPDVRQKFARQRMLFSQESKCTEVYEQDKKSQKTWRSEKGSFFSRRTPNTCIYLTLKKASGIKYCYLLPKAWNLHGCFFYLPVNASICLSNTKPHCVTNLRASTQRCALRVLELLSSSEYSAQTEGQKMCRSCADGLAWRSAEHLIKHDLAVLM